MKAFIVEPGYDVLHNGVWHGPGLQVIVEQGETIEVYVTPGGRRGACIGKYTYAKLDPDKPPIGLRCKRGML